MKNAFGAKVVRIDLRDQLGAHKTPDVSEFLDKAAHHAHSPFFALADAFVKNAREQLSGLSKDDQSTKAVDIVNAHLEMMNVLDLVDEGYCFSESQLREVTGLSRDEVIYLEAVAYAEALGLEITALEKSAAAQEIFGENFPFSRHKNEFAYLENGGDFNVQPNLNNPDEPS